MGKQTDYKRLWRNEKRVRIIADNELGKANEIIKIQGGMIRDLQKKHGKEDK